MARKKKQEIKINNSESLENLCQETYNDACLQIIDAQRSINELVNGNTPNDVDEATKIAKEKGGLLKIKDSAIRIKLELAKLQSDIIKNKGDLTTTLSQRSDGQVSKDDFKNIREMIKNAGKNPEEEND